MLSMQVRALIVFRDGFVSRGGQLDERTCLGRLARIVSLSMSAPNNGRTLERRKEFFGRRVIELGSAHLITRHYLGRGSTAEKCTDPLFHNVIVTR